MTERLELLPTKYIEALNFAAELHREQARKGSRVPYLTHLMTVSSYVFEFGGNLEQAIAGLLHDSIEDQGSKTSFQEIETRFGKQVCEIVRACTDSETEPKPPWLERKTQYLDGLRDKSNTIKLVVACDKLHNAECIVRDLRIHGLETMARFQAPAEQTLWYYQSIVDTLQDLPSPIVQILDQKVQEMAFMIESQPATRKG